MQMETVLDTTEEKFNCGIHVRIKFFGKVLDMICCMWESHAKWTVWAMSEITRVASHLEFSDATKNYFRRF